MQKVRKFPIGGTHLPENKDLTTDSPIRDLPLPSQVTIPLKQHLGVICRALVSVGDRVTAGQLIGDNEQGLSAKIHTGISGTVTAIKKQRQIDNSEIMSVVINRDTAANNTANNTADNTAANNTAINNTAAKNLTVGGLPEPVPDLETVIKRVKEAGIVGMGGATFPTHVKFMVKEETPIDAVIINGAECEPYITTDDRLMQEETAELFRGLEIIRQTVKAEQGYVACEINKPAAIKQIEKEAEKWPHLHAVRLDTRYPHGAEKHLIKAVLNREVPIRELPMAVGVIVNNVQTSIAVARAVDTGTPLTHRVLTVSGSAVKRPGNFRVPLGTALRDVITAAGGASLDNHRVIVGGPMTGIVTENLDIPITKGTSGVVLIRPEEYADRSTEVCIRCGNCVSVCPMYLQPNWVTSYVRNDMLAEAEEFGVLDCILCGACSYVCPSRRPLLQWLREGKGRVAAAVLKGK